jgi:surface protein
MFAPIIAFAYEFEVDGIYYNINGNEAEVTQRGDVYSGPEQSYSGSIIIPSTVTHNGTTYSVTRIGFRAFSNNENLYHVEMPNTITAIDDYAFAVCPCLNSIDIPNSVTSIGVSILMCCSGLESIIVASDNPRYDSRDNCNAIIETQTNTLIQGCQNTNIPYTITQIGHSAFYGCSSLTSIEIPGSVLSIGSCAFYDCSNLSVIDVPNSVYSIGGYAFYNTAWYNNQPDGMVYTGLVLYKYKGRMPSGTNIVINDGTITIAVNAFENCRGLSGIEIPNSVTTIGDYAFHNCTSLTTISIPNSVTSIGSAVFSECSSLASFELPISINTISNYMFSGCSSLTSIEIPSWITSIGHSAFAHCHSLVNIELPNSITSINDFTFYDCTSLNCFEIPDHITYIGCGAFSDCSHLSHVFIPHSVNTIGNQVFENCSGLQDVNIPNSVTAIGDYMFSGCSSLTSIEIPNSITYIGSLAFSDCRGLTEVAIPNSVKSIGPWAFHKCTSLTSIEIPNSVTYIDGGAFIDCTGLERVTIGNSINSIRERAFTNCDEIKDVYCYSTSPPECDDNTFTNYGGTLHVQATSIAAYFTAPCWRNFATIVGDAVGPIYLLISNDSIELKLGEQFNLTASIVPSNSTSSMIIWNSTNPTIATVENGVVTAIGIGECDIKAACFGMQVICHIIVKDQIKLDYEEVSVLPNHIISLTPSASLVLPELIVESSDPTIAAARLINGQVQVVGIKEGTTIVTVSSIDDSAQEATCLVTVYTESGDMNCDGFVNISDVTSLIDYLLSGDDSQISNKNADVNGDESINISDVTELIDILLQGNG